MRRLFGPCAAVLGTLAVASSPAHSQLSHHYETLPPVVGPAVVKGGNLLWINNKFITLYNITAPQYDDQCAGSNGTIACGKASADALSKFIGGQPLSCKTQMDQTYICRRPDNQDIAWFMVYFGYAKSTPTGDYRKDMHTAAMGRHGLWGHFLYDWSVAGL